MQLSFDVPVMPFRYERGIHLEDAGMWLDPHTRRPVAYVSHGHSDHCRPHGHAFVTAETADFYRLRTGRSALTVMNIGETLTRGLQEVDVFPAGHVLGSSQVRVRDLATGHRLVYTGDFKLRPSLTSPSAPVLECETLVMECTYGAPRFTFPPTEQVVTELIAWVGSVIASGNIPVVCGYALGKAQEAMAILHQAGHLVAIHPSIEPYAEIYTRHGVDLGQYVVMSPDPGSSSGSEGRVIVCPPQHARSIREAMPRTRMMILTGWAIDGGAPGRMPMGTALPLSDHAGFDDLVEYVQRARPKIVYTVHGNGGFAQHLRRQGIEAHHLGA